MLRALFLGVVTGPAGIAAVAERLPAARAGGGFDLVVACADFARGRSPYDEASLKKLFAAGVDLLAVSLAAVSDRQLKAIDSFPDRILPPANHPLFRDDPRAVRIIRFGCDRSISNGSTPFHPRLRVMDPPDLPAFCTESRGLGSVTPAGCRGGTPADNDAPGRDRLLVVNLGGLEGLISVTGSEQIAPLDSPYAALERIRAANPGARLAVTFFSHSTHEKEAFATWLDGDVDPSTVTVAPSFKDLFAGYGQSVKTADEMTLAGGLAYVTDLGTVGPRLVETAPVDRPSPCVYRTLRPARPPALTGNTKLAGSAAYLHRIGDGRIVAGFEPWRESAAPSP